MKQIFVLFTTFLVSQSIFSQVYKERLYYEGEFGFITALLAENNEGRVKFFSASGLNLRAGVGANDESKTVFVGFNSGLDVNYRRRLAIVPLYINSKILLEFSDDKHLILSFG
jgi:hypothetical protein